MKKFLMFAVMLVISLPLFGFNLDYGAITNKNGTVVEYVSVYCKDKVLEDLDISQSQFNQVLLSACDSSIPNNVLEKLKNLFLNKIDSDTELNAEAKQKLKSFYFSAKLLENKFFLSINYSSVEIWKYFCSQGDEPTQEFSYHFLTYDVISTIKPKISTFVVDENVLTMPQFVFNLLSEKISEEFGGEALTALGSPEYEYSYVTTKRRVHSNADETFYNDGFWYHSWSIESLDDSIIKIYTTYANAVVWYLLALGLTGIFMLVVVLKSKNDARKKKGPKTS